MAVLRTIRAIGADGQTEICQLNVQDGGQAAEIIALQDWRTPAELRDIAKACIRMAEVVEGYIASGEPDTASVADGGV